MTWSVPLRNTALTVLDFETTGSVPGFPSEPWQVGCIPFVGGKPVPDGSFESLVQVGDRPFNPAAPGRHAELRESLRLARPLTARWTELRPLLTGRPLAAHNVATERAVLETCFPLQTFGPWIDTLTLVRVVYPDLSSHRLEDVIPALGLQERLASCGVTGGPHDALYDAAACAVLLEHMLEQPGWENLTVEAAAAQRASAFFRKPRSRS